MKKRLGRSLFFRYSLTFMLILLVSFLILVALIDFVLGRYYMDDCQKELSRLSSSGSNLIQLDYRWVKDYGVGDWLEDDKNKDWLWRSLGALYNETDTYIFVTDDRGEVLYAPDADMVGKIVSSDVRLDQNDTPTDSGVSKCGIYSERQYYYAEKVIDDDDGRQFATVYACIPMALVRAPVTAIMRIIVFICLWVMLAAVVAAYFISERITKPLARMSEAAKAFADGDFSVRVPEKGGSEIAEFARVFNDMADSLENTDQTRNDFIANVSHDLRSPMTSINGFIDGMLTGVIPPEKHEHYMRVVLSETRRLSRLVATLLDISKIQAGERKFRKVSFDICEMARQIIISFETRIDAKNLDIHFESDADRIYVSADMDAIYQVLYNLCDNATKFAHDEKKVTLSIREQGNLVSIHVFNEGDGIREEDLKQVFDRFYKADRSRGIDKTGTGLGLYISQKIVEAHKQKITVESRYGESCTFSFSLEKGERPIHKAVK